MPATRKTTARPASAASSKPSTGSRKRKADEMTTKYYAVKAGKKPGVYMSWPECQAQTAGFKGAVYKSFLSMEDARAFVAGKTPPSAAGTEPTKFYAVAVGNQPGIYTEWADAQEAILGAKGPKYKKFETRLEALNFIREKGNAEALAVIGELARSSSKRAKTSASATKAAAAVAPAQPERLEGAIDIYTDGSSLANGKKGAVAGVGVFFGEDDPRNVSERLEGQPQTNQRAELTAILRALEIVPATQGVRIVTDSQYSINCVTDWYRNWEANGWNTRGGPVKNRDLVEAIRAEIDERDEMGAVTAFQWVKGHAATEGNVAADQLAVDGAKRR